MESRVEDRAAVTPPHVVFLTSVAAGLRVLCVHAAHAAGAIDDRAKSTGVKESMFAT